MCVVNKFEPEDREFIENNLDSNTILGVLPKSKNIKNFEQGDNEAFDKYLIECKSVFEKIENEALEIDRDWDFYLKNIIDTHRKNSITWYNNYYSQKLETQIENNFNYKSVILD